MAFSWNPLKLLSYQNVKSDPIFMTGRGNLSMFMPKHENRSKLMCRNATPGSFNKPQSQVYFKNSYNQVIINGKFIYSHLHLE